MCLPLIWRGKNLNSIPKIEYLTQGHLNRVLNAGHDGRHHRIPNDLPAVGNLDNCQIGAFFCQEIPPFRPHQFLKSLYVQLRPHFRIYVLLIRYGRRMKAGLRMRGVGCWGMAERIADVYDYREREYGQTRVLSNTIKSEHIQNQYIRLEDAELVTVKAHGARRFVLMNYGTCSIGSLKMPSKQICHSNTMNMNHRTKIGSSRSAATSPRKRSCYFP